MLFALGPEEHWQHASSITSTSLLLQRRLFEQAFCVITSQGQRRKDSKEQKPGEIQPVEVWADWFTMRAKFRQDKKLKPASECKDCKVSEAMILVLFEVA